MVIMLVEALRDIACERGRCSECGRLADLPSNCISCDDYKRCRWDTQDPTEIAKAAILAYESHLKSHKNG